MGITDDRTSAAPGPNARVRVMETSRSASDRVVDEWDASVQELLPDRYVAGGDVWSGRRARTDVDSATGVPVGYVSMVRRPHLHPSWSFVRVHDGRLWRITNLTGTAVTNLVVQASDAFVIDGGGVHHTAEIEVGEALAVTAGWDKDAWTTSGRVRFEWTGGIVARERQVEMHRLWPRGNAWS